MFCGYSLNGYAMRSAASRPRAVDRLTFRRPFCYSLPVIVSRSIVKRSTVRRPFVKMFFIISDNMERRVKIINLTAVFVCLVFLGFLSYSLEYFGDIEKDFLMRVYCFLYVFAVILILNVEEI